MLNNSPRHGAVPAADWSGLHLSMNPGTMTAMAPSLLTYLENYHWKGYSVDMVVDHANTMMCLHRGNFPLNGLCKNVELGCVPFNLVESWVWVHMEKLNIVWTDDEAWLPQDSDILTRTYMPHGFYKVLIHETDEAFLSTWIECCGRVLPLCSRDPP